MVCFAYACISKHELLMYKGQCKCSSAQISFWFHFIDTFQPVFDTTDLSQPEQTEKREQILQSPGQFEGPVQNEAMIEGQLGTQVENQLECQFEGQIVGQVEGEGLIEGQIQGQRSGQGQFMSEQRFLIEMLCF